MATFIDPTSLAKIGNLIGFGGLAASFDGTNSKVRTSCSYKANASGYVGVTFASPKRLEICTIYPSSDMGFAHDAQTGDTTVQDWYAKQGAAPASETDGTIIATSGSHSDDPTVPPQTLNSTDTTTAWDHGWVRTTPSTGDSQISQFLQYEFDPTKVPYNPHMQRSALLAQRTIIGWSAVAERWWRRRGRALWVPEPVLRFAR